MLWALDQVLRPIAQRAGLSSVQIVLFEHLALAVIFLPSLIKFKQQWQRLPHRSWIGLAFIAIFGSAIATVMLTEAYRLGSPLVAALLQKTQPIFTVLLAGIFLGERRKPFFWPLFLLALLATFLLAFGFHRIEGSLQVLPVALALGVSAIWGTCTVVGRFTVRDLDPSVVAGWRFVIALPVLIALGFQQGTNSIGSHLNIQSLWPVFCTMLVSNRRQPRSRLWQS